MGSDKPRNDIGRWIMLAVICAGGSTGGTMLRGHNPNITTEAWVKLQIDLETLKDHMRDVRADLQSIMRRMPQQPP